MSVKSVASWRGMADQVMGGGGVKVMSLFCIAFVVLYSWKGESEGEGNPLFPAKGGTPYPLQ